MSFNARFFTFSKKINSTKRPSGGSSYSIILKAPSGVLDPVIQLDIGQDGNPTAYNWAIRRIDIGRTEKLMLIEDEKEVSE